jgi:hypothetical protein
MNNSEYREYLRRHKRSQNKGAYGKDSEMGKVYKSEWAIAKMMKDKNTSFDNISQAQKYVDRITKSKTWQKVRSNRRSNVTLVAMKDQSGGVAATAWGGYIKIKPGYMEKYVILHELAHEAGHMHHGRSFRQCLLKLVSQFMGRDVAEALKAEFKKHKLAFGDARKPLTEAKWLEAKNRMRSIRG